MRRISAFILCSTFCVIALVFLAQSVFANHGQKVLGLATSSSEATIPPTTEGPGLLLPDSPLFFLDQLKQQARVLFAFSPEKKADIYTEIAGERMAELRFMLARKSESGMKIALDGISENLNMAANELNTAQLSGRNVSVLAKNLNTIIKEKQATLDLLEVQESGEMKSRVNATNRALLVAKVKIEDALPSDDLQNEMEEDLKRKVALRVREGANSARELENDLEELNSQIRDASSRAIQRREDALKKAIAEKNEPAQKEAQKLLDAERRKQEGLQRIYVIMTQDALDTMKKAQESALKFDQARVTTETIKNQAVTASASSSGNANH